MKMNLRSMRTLATIGVDLDDKDFFALPRGTVYRTPGQNSRNPTFVPDTKGDARFTSRMHLVNLTFDAALKQGVRFFFEHSAKAVNFENKTVFVPPPKSRQQCGRPHYRGSSYIV